MKLAQTYLVTISVCGRMADKFDEPPHLCFHFQGHLQTSRKIQQTMSGKQKGEAGIHRTESTSAMSAAPDSTAVRNPCFPCIRPVSLLTRVGTFDETGCPSVRLMCNPIGRPHADASRAASTADSPFTSKLALDTIPSTYPWICQHAGCQVCQRTTRKLGRTMPLSRLLLYPRSSALTIKCIVKLLLSTSSTFDVCGTDAVCLRSSAPSSAMPQAQGKSSCPLQCHT